MFKRKYIVATVLLSLVALFCFVPIPAYIETVGNAQNVEKYVSIDGRRDTRKGQFMLTYVGIGRATPALYVASYFDKYATRLPGSAVRGNSSTSEYNKVQHYYMDDALNQAKTVSLKLASKPVRQNFKGMVVMSLLDNSSFKGKLQVGDIVTGVDKKKFGKAANFMRYLQQKKNTVVSLHYRRGRTNHSTKGKLIHLPGTSKKGIGISFVQKSKVISPVKIKTDMDGIEGPSAGLMLTLQMYTQLSHEDLKKGRKIAGTGTMLSDGKIGDIGGIDKKVVAAANKKASIFFAPNNPLTRAEKKAGELNNYQEAKKAAKKIGIKMKIVPVKNVQEAISYLR